jgi:carbonic anhydrase
MRTCIKPLLFLLAFTSGCAEHSTLDYADPEQGIGHSQSPVNIVTADAQPDQQNNVVANFEASFASAENLGHTVELKFAKGSTATIEGQKCTARQLHFHTPSEHLIDGLTYPMEMHIVSTVKDSNEEKEPTYFVIGVLFKMGLENPFLKEFQHFVPAEPGERFLDSGDVKMKDLLTLLVADHALSCFTYHGSLTTAPYSENVHWIVLNHPLEASPAQIMAIEKLEGNNNRHVQSLYDRHIAMH